MSNNTHYCEVIKNIKKDYNNNSLKKIKEYNFDKCLLKNKEHIFSYYNFIINNYSIEINNNDYVSDKSNECDYNDYNDKSSNEYNEGNNYDNINNNINNNSNNYNTNNYICNTNIFKSIKDCNTKKKLNTLKTIIINITDNNLLNEIFLYCISLLRNGSFHHKIFLTNLLTIYNTNSCNGDNGCNCDGDGDGKSCNEYDNCNTNNNHVTNITTTNNNKTNNNNTNHTITLSLYTDNANKRLNDYNTLKTLLEDENEEIRYNTINLLYVFYNKKYYNFIIKILIYSLNDTQKIQNKIIRILYRIIDKIENEEFKILLRSIKDENIKYKIYKLLTHIKYNKRQMIIVLNELHKYIKEKNVDIFEFIKEYSEYNNNGYEYSGNVCKEDSGNKGDSRDNGNDINNTYNYDNNKQKSKIIENINLSENVKRIKLNEECNNDCEYGNNNDSDNDCKYNNTDKYDDKNDDITNNHITNHTTNNHITNNITNQNKNKIYVYENKNDNRIFNIMYKIIMNNKNNHNISSIENKYIRSIIEYIDNKECNKKYNKEYINYLEIGKENKDNYKEYILDYLYSYIKYNKYDNKYNNHHTTTTNNHIITNHTTTNHNSINKYYKGLFKFLEYPKTEIEYFYKSIIDNIDKDIRILNIYYRLNNHINNIEDIINIIESKYYNKIKRIKYNIDVTIKIRRDSSKDMSSRDMSNNSNINNSITTNIINNSNTNNIVFVEIKNKYYKDYRNIYYRIFYGGRIYILEIKNICNIYFNLLEECIGIEIIYKDKDKEIIIRRRYNYFIY